VLLTFLCGSAWAQEGWGGTQEPPLQSEELPAVEAVEPPGQAPDEQPLGELVPPTLLELPELDWPEGEAPRQVTVQLLLLLDERGSIEQIGLVSGEEPFAGLALARASEIRFSPALEGGQPIAVELPFAWTFDPPVENVVGRLRVAGSREPARRVTVLVDGSSTETDEAGRFSFRGLEPGPHTVEIADPTLRLKPMAFEVQADGLVELDLIARREGADDEALGTWQRGQSQVLSRSLSAAELRSTPGTMGDPVRAVQNLPGVVRTPFDAGWMLVRGGDPEDTGVYIDGVRVPIIYHLGGYTSVLHPSMVGGVEFMPGGYGVRYGRSTAGAVDLLSAPVQGERRVELGADLLHAGVYAQTPLGDRNAVAVAVRRSYLDKILGAVLSPEQARIAPRFFDWQGRWDSERAGVFVLGYRDAIDAPTGEDDETVRIDIITHRVHGRLDLDTGIGQLRLTPVVARDKRVFDYSDEFQELKTDTVALRAERLDLDGGQLGVEAGLDAQVSAFSVHVESADRSGLVASADPYAQVRIGSGTRLVAGLRLDTFYAQGQLLRAAPSPRVQGAWEILPSLSLVGDLGISHQAPGLELVIGLPDGRYLQLEEARGGGLGARWRHDQLGLDVDGFVRQLDNVTMWEDDGSLGQGKGLAYGVETLARWKAGRAAGWVAYTWSRGLRQQEAGDLYEPYRYDQPHYLVVVGSLALRRNLTLASRFRAGSGYPRDPNSDAAYDLLSVGATEVPLDTRRLRLEPYYALDLKISKEATFRAWQLEYYLDIQNVSNHRMPEPLITGVDDRQAVYAYGLPVLPIFGVKGVFWPGAGLTSE
jgi:hypothetical protein